MAWCEAFLDKAVLSRIIAVIIASRLEACTSVPFWLGGQRVLLLMLITWKTDVCVLGFIAAGQCTTLAPRSLWQIATNATAQIYKLAIKHCLIVDFLARVVKSNFAMSLLLNTTNVVNPLRQAC